MLGIKLPDVRKVDWWRPDWASPKYQYESHQNLMMHQHRMELARKNCMSNISRHVYTISTHYIHPFMCCAAQSQNMGFKELFGFNADIVSRNAVMSAIYGPAEELDLQSKITWNIVSHFANFQLLRSPYAVDLGLGSDNETQFCRVVLGKTAMLRVEDIIVMTKVYTDFFKVVWSLTNLPRCTMNV